MTSLKGSKSTGTGPRIVPLHDMDPESYIVSNPDLAIKIIEAKKKHKKETAHLKQQEEQKTRESELKHHKKQILNFMNGFLKRLGDLCEAEDPGGIIKSYKTTIELINSRVIYFNSLLLTDCPAYFPGDYPCVVGSHTQEEIDANIFDLYHENKHIFNKLKDLFASLGPHLNEFVKQRIILRLDLVFLFCFMIIHN